MALQLFTSLILLAAFHIDYIDAFRSDYTYIDSTRSYYKHHRKEASWEDANTKCKSEGAQLFYPENEIEIVQVLSLIKAKNTAAYFLLGISDLRELHVYETVDGRPISQVYNKWYRGQPDSCSDNTCRCVILDVSDHTLFAGYCYLVRLYICKHELVSENVVPPTAIEELKTIIGNASRKEIATLDHLIEVTQGQAANVTAALERLIETSQILAANQATASKNQTIAIERLTQILQEQAVNQTAALERQERVMQRLVLALEKLAEDNDELGVRSQPVDNHI